MVYHESIYHIGDSYFFMTKNSGVTRKYTPYVYYHNVAIIIRSVAGNDFHEFLPLTEQGRRTPKRPSLLLRMTSDSTRTSTRRSNVFFGDNGAWKPAS